MAKIDYKISGTIENSRTLVYEGEALRNIVKAYKLGYFNEFYLNNVEADMKYCQYGNTFYLQYRNKNGDIVYRKYGNSTIHKVTMNWNHVPEDTFKFLGNSLRIADIFDDISEENPYIRFSFFKGYFPEYKYPDYTPIPENERVALMPPEFITNGDTSAIFSIDAKKPAISNISLIRNEKNYCIEITGEYSCSCKVEIYKTDENGIETLSKTYNFNPSLDGVTSSNAVSKFFINNSNLQYGQNKLKITPSNYTVSGKTYTKSFQHITAKISSLTISNNNNYVTNPTTLSWESENQYYAIVILNNVKIADLTTEKSYTIPPNTLKNGENLIIVCVCNEPDSEVINSSIYVNVSKTINFSIPKPKISDLDLENDGNLIDNDTLISWVSENQYKAKIYNNNVLIKEFDGSGQTTLIPKGKLKVGTNKIKVVIYNYYKGEYVEAQATKSITLKQIEAEITKNSLSISGTNVDEDIKVTWEATNQTKVKIYQDATLIKELKTTSQEYTIPKGTLTTGTKNLRLVVIYSGAGGDVKTDKIITRTFTRNEPVIYSIEPSNLNIDVDVSRIISFNTNEFVDRWELSFAGMTTKGTTERQVTASPGTFSVGENSIKLTLYYSPPYNKSETRKTTKTVTFTGYGTPDKPYILCDKVYHSALPTFKWEFQGQTAYQVILTDGINITEDTGNLFGTEKEFTPSQELTDNTMYILKVRCRGNRKWSEFTVKTFETKFSDIEIPKFYLMEVDGHVNVSIYGKQPKDFDVLSIYRKDEITDEWVEIAFNCNVKDSISDRLCPTNIMLSYKLRVYNSSGAYKDSEIKTITTSISNYILTKIDGSQVDFKFKEVNVTYNHNTSEVVKIYSGSKKPVIFKGKEDYLTGTIEATFKNEDALKFLKFYNPNATYCLKDIRGKRTFVEIKLNSEKPYGTRKTTYSISFTETNFDESRINEGIGRIKYTYVDGEYKVDGSIDLSGVDKNYYI